MRYGICTGIENTRLVESLGYQKAVTEEVCCRRAVPAASFELYRRVLCNDPGGLVERGEYFSSEEELKKTIQNVCFHNVNAFLGFGVTI